MHRISPTVAVYLTAAAVTTMLACDVATPLTPAPAKPASSTAADGTTLKVSAPTLVSPVNDITTDGTRPVFNVTPVAGQFSTSVPGLTYEFELDNDAGSAIDRTFVAGTSWEYPTPLSPDTPFRWRVRATSGSATGPWSSVGRFQTPKQRVAPAVTASIEEWHQWFNDLVKEKGQPTCSLNALIAIRPDVNAAGAEFQNAFRGVGEMRPRMFLPVPGCPGNAVNNPSPPGCAFNRTVDIGNFGGSWQWVPR